MKTTTTSLALMLFAASTLHAQSVANGATNTLSNVTNACTGDVTVGANGSFPYSENPSADRFGQISKL